jgi:hypothetical protein
MIKKVLKHRCSKCLQIVHLDLICLSIIKRRGESQIGTPDHKFLESRGQMRSDWGVLYTVGKIFLRVIKYYLLISKEIFF